MRIRQRIRDPVWCTGQTQDGLLFNFPTCLTEPKQTKNSSCRPVRHPLLLRLSSSRLQTVAKDSIRPNPCTASLLLAIQILPPPSISLDLRSIDRCACLRSSAADVVAGARVSYRLSTRERLPWRLSIWGLVDLWFASERKLTVRDGGDRRYRNRRRCKAMRGREDERKLWRLLRSYSSSSAKEYDVEVVISGRRRIWGSFLKVLP